MPRLDGIQVALALRELRPEIRLALHSADARAYRDHAREHRLLLFDKLEPERALSWLELEAERRLRPRERSPRAASRPEPARATTPAA